MNNPTLSLPKILLALGDAAVFFSSIASALILRYGGLPDPAVLDLYLFAAPFLTGLWLLGFLVFGLYDLRLAKNEPAFFERLAKAIGFNFTITVILFYLIPEFGLRPIFSLLIIFAAMSVLSFGWRQMANAGLKRGLKERVLFIGGEEEVEELERFLAENPQLGFAAAGRTPINENGAIEHSLSDTVRREKITLLVIGPEIKKSRFLAKALFGVLPLGAGAVDFYRFYEAVHGKIPLPLINEAWFIENLIGQRRPRYEAAKRILDLTLALLLGLAALIILPLVALTIAFSTPRDLLRYRTLRARPGDGIIFFRQPRVGRHGRVFDFVKFRSQQLGAEKMGYEKQSGPDPRAYPAGTFLRRTYLDELPQLWNVIKGEMSFVGPRPERPEFVSELEREIPFYRMRELALPGITGWAQINMENDASVSDAPEKMQYDLYYIKNRSLALDLTILAKTALKLMQRSGR